MFECVINISEGRESERLAAFSLAAGISLRDVHADPDHHRSVFTLINDPDSLVRDVHQLISSVVGTLNIAEHEGVHPRMGVVDVVPFVALHPEQTDRAIALRDETAAWMGRDLGVPTFLYGRERTLPEVRRRAFDDLAPDFGPSRPHPTAGAAAVGQRDVLIAWNLWIAGISLSDARHIAREIRSPDVRALGLAVGGAVQVSCNIIDVRHTHLSTVYDRVQELLPQGGRILRSELVGLTPRLVLESEDQARWEELGLGPRSTIESRIGR